MQEIKIAMVVAASKALDYKKKYPYSDVDEVIKAIFKEVDAEGVAKLASVVAISRAMKYKRQPSVTDKQVMQKLTDEMDSIISNLVREEKE